MALILLGAARFSISSLFLLIYIYTAELFPTQIRSIAFGGCNMVARFGTFISPNLLQIGKYFHIEPFLILACMQVVAGFSATKLEETLGKPMKELVDSDQTSREIEIVEIKSNYAEPTFKKLVESD